MLSSGEGSTLKFYSTIEACRVWSFFFPSTLMQFPRHGIETNFNTVYSQKSEAFLRSLIVKRKRSSGLT